MNRAGLRVYKYCRARAALLIIGRSERLLVPGAVYLAIEGLVGLHEERFVRTIVKPIEVRRSSLAKGTAPYCAIAGGGQHLPERFKVVLVSAAAELISGSRIVEEKFQRVLALAALI